jgi:hypothetical protein
MRVRHLEQIIKGMRARTETEKAARCWGVLGDLLSFEGEALSGARGSGCPAVSLQLFLTALGDAPATFFGIWASSDKQAIGTVGDDRHPSFGGSIFSPSRRRYVVATITRVSAASPQRGQPRHRNLASTIAPILSVPRFRDALSTFAAPEHSHMMRPAQDP